MPDKNIAMPARLSVKDLIRLTIVGANLLLLTACGEAATDGLAADILIAQHKYDAASKEADRAITLSPKSAQLYWARGYSYLQLGQAQRAIEDLTKAIDLGKTEGSVKEIYYWSRAIAYQQVDRQQDALNDCAQAIALNPSKPDFHIFLVRGYSEGKLGQHDPEIADYTKAIDSSKLSVGYLYRALTYETQGKTDLAKADRDAAMKADGGQQPDLSPVEKLQLHMR